HEAGVFGPRRDLELDDRFDAHASGLARNRSFHGVVDGEDLGEAGDLEHLQDAGLRADEREVAVVAAKALETADEHAQAGGVEEVDALQVHDDLVLALADEFHQLLAQAGSRIDVHLAAHGEDRRAVLLLYIETKLHRQGSSWSAVGCKPTQPIVWSAHG